MDTNNQKNNSWFICILIVLIALIFGSCEGNEEEHDESWYKMQICHNLGGSYHVFTGACTLR